MFFPLSFSWMSFRKRPANSITAGSTTSEQRTEISPGLQESLERVFKTLEEIKVVLQWLASDEDEDECEEDSEECTQEEEKEEECL